MVGGGALTLIIRNTFTSYRPFRFLLSIVEQTHQVFCCWNSLLQNETTTITTCSVFCNVDLIARFEELGAFFAE